ncbi:MAG: tRNA (N(6)-L-threonylcarbamoyladenosine(37)-C(2))-methylthiotransferase MtaB [Pseudomonadota bacterium]
MNKQTFALYTLGCRTNSYDSDQIIGSLINAGYSQVDFDKKADVYVINTCTVTSKTDAQSRNIIKRAVKMNDKAKVIVTGCYVDRDASEIENIEGVTCFMGNDHKSFIARILEDKNYSIEKEIKINRFSWAGPGSRLTRPNLKIQDGCDNACSYCIVPTVRGSEVSLEKDEVVKRMIAYADNQAKELVLTGIHIGRYGKDFYVNESLVSLLKLMLSRIEELGLRLRLRLSSIEPEEISDELIELVAESPYICKHFHIPLQSGSNSILKKMNRNYEASMFAELVQKIKAKNPDIVIGTDIICGYPGESDEEFKQTYDFIKSLELSYGHVFPYSDRPGTKSFEIKEKVDDRIKKERAKELRDLFSRKKQEFLDLQINKKFEVLLEEKENSATGNLTGLSSNYIRFLVASDKENKNNFVNIKAVSIIKEGLIKGEIII